MIGELNVLDLPMRVAVACMTTAALATSALAEDGSSAALAAYTAKPEHVVSLMSAVKPY